MMWNSGNKILTVHACKRKLGNDFSAFFTNTILNIRSELGFRDAHTGGSMTNLREHPQMKIDEKELEVVTDFTYLGINITVLRTVY